MRVWGNSEALVVIYLSPCPPTLYTIPFNESRITFIIMTNSKSPTIVSRSKALVLIHTIYPLHSLYSMHIPLHALYYSITYSPYTLYSITFPPTRSIESRIAFTIIIHSNSLILHPITDKITPNPTSNPKIPINPRRRPPRHCHANPEIPDPHLPYSHNTGTNRFDH